MDFCSAVSDFLGGQQSQTVVHTDKQQYCAGERVTGTVVVSVAKPVHVNEIYLKVEGRRRVSFVQSVPVATYSGRREVSSVQNVPVATYSGHPSGSTMPIMSRWVTDKNVFFQRRLGLQTTECTLERGSFVFPFDFELDAGLPATFSLPPAAHQISGKISYSVEAEVVVAGMFRCNMQHNQQLSLHQPFTQPPAKPYQFSHDERITACCCFPLGQVSVAVTTDKMAYCSGEMCNIKLLVDAGKLGADISSISFRLQRNVGVRVMTTVADDQQTVVSSRTHAVSGSQTVQRAVLLPIPHDATPSYTSESMWCGYTLMVRLHVSWASDVVLQAPIQIYARQLASGKSRAG